MQRTIVNAKDDVFEQMLLSKNKQSYARKQKSTKAYKARKTKKN